ncbi:MAG: DoxX family membrane protein, partial [Flavobacteriales bacterium]|nr:DoxX family membrane protein [Flavobacteriales bacterium]
MKIFINICRIIVGSLFILSGLIKANDALGFKYKLLEYFSERALGFPDLIPYALGLAIFLCIGEILLGAAMLLGAFPKLTNVLFMFLLLFFAWLTYYTASCDPFVEQEFVNAAGEVYMATPECVNECGCFGNAIPLTPWESFYKDIFILFFAIFTFIAAFTGKIKLNTPKEDIFLVTGSLLFVMVFSLLMLDWLFPVLFTALLLGVGILIKRYAKRNEWLMALGVLAVIGYFQYHTLNHLPVKDYRPYAVGKNIPDGMMTAEEKGLKAPVYANVYTMKNKDTGETMNMNSLDWTAQRMWEKKEWEIVSTADEPIKLEDGYEPPIPPDFEFTDFEGEIVTE